MSGMEAIADGQQICFHCGERVLPGADYSLEIDGERHAMCCPGCRAVACLITSNGLGRFYEQRTAFNTRPDDVLGGDRESYSVYDDPSLLAQFSTRDSEGRCELRLLVSGVSCAACTWLIEGSLGRLPGVARASLNLTQNRLDVTVDLAKTSASEIFAALHALGYSVQPWQSSVQQEQARREFKSDLRRLAVAGIGMMQVGMFGIALHAGDVQGISEEYQRLLRLASFLVTAFVIFFSARGFFSSAWRHLRHGVLVMDLPVALAIGLAFAASSLATFRGIGDVYFDSVVMFTFLLLLARFAEKRLRLRDALAWQDAEQMLPDAVRAWRDDAWRLVPRRSVQPGERLRVRSGDTIAVDATIRSGDSAVREDSFNGEALPRRVRRGDCVYAGTVNEGGTLELVATATYADSRLAALQNSIDSAGREKPALARLADRVASVFITAVLLATALTALAWWQIDPSRAFWVAVSVLVISCPCALSLATPAALANAASSLRRAGIIVHGENALEGLARATHAVFDKTGTLTSDAFEVARVEALHADAPRHRQLIGIVAALQAHSSHPVASAFRDALGSRQAQAVEVLVGAGLEGSIDGIRYRVGSPDFCREWIADLPPAPPEPLYWIALCDRQRALAWLGLRDELRPEARTLVTALRAEGLTTELLTGDASARAAQLGSELRFDSVMTGRTPEQKLAEVARLQASGAVVLMVGDGLNDAPVLKRADASVAVAGATDLARSQADFVIIGGDLSQISRLRRVALRTRRVIKQNFAWALSYNVVGIPLAAAGFVPPWLAAIGMSLSSLLVVANASRLRNLPSRER